MSALKKLEGVGPNKPYLGFARRAPGYYSIISFRSVKNKFGKKSDSTSRSVLIELEDQVLFLPQHFSQRIADDDIRELNTTIEKKDGVYIYFGGRDEKTK